MPDCSSLARANESRRRAWKELQRLRRLLTSAGAPIEPPQKPADFEAEGRAIAAALAWVLLEHADRLNRLKRLFVYYEQAMEVPYSAEAQRCALTGVETFLRVTLPPAAFVEELRKLSGYTGEGWDKVERGLPTVTKSAKGPAHPTPPASNGDPTPPPA